MARRPSRSAAAPSTAIRSGPTRRSPSSSVRTRRRETSSVHVAGKGDSNGLPFTVRAGNIYFVTATGSDSANGSFTAPWKTIPKAKNSLAAGDIAYLGVKRGRHRVADDAGLDRGVPLRARDEHQTARSNSGTAAAPKALVAYPGAGATIGTESGLQRGHPHARDQRDVRLLGHLAAHASRPDRGDRLRGRRDRLARRRQRHLLPQRHRGRAAA